MTHPTRRRLASNLSNTLVIALVAAAGGCASGKKHVQVPGPWQGKVFVSNERSGDIAVIDNAQRKFLGMIAVGKRPRGILVSRDGTVVYVALSGSPIGGPKVDESKLPPADKRADGIGMI